MLNPRCSMKHLLLLIAAALALAACNRDPEHSQNLLVGTWSMTSDYESGYTSTTTITIGPDGKYACQVVGHGRSGTVRTFDMRGTWLVKNGMLIDTMTNHSTTNFALPLVSRALIVGMDNREMLLRWEPHEGWTYATNEALYRKISK